ncbi:YCII-related protein [Streptomyces laurentii]|uniref:YCII-related protein n=1 Tax=Streptomyces laurentii TaxID=39478 RepID=A0A160P786_STRLU|nr:YCII-related protein [Streptomyces laurentii]
MFVLELTYTAPIERIDELIPAHRTWLEARYAEGVFLASGRKEPREGGVILAGGVGRSEIEMIVATDPFSVAGVCTYRIMEFLATKTVKELAPFRDELPAS